MIRWFLLFISPVLLAHQEHSTFGVHGLVMMQVDSKVIASHLPMPRGMHARQFLFEIKPTPALAAILDRLFKSQVLVTFSPTPFELDKLRHGEISVLSGSVYQGHFERGGNLLGTNVTFEVGKVILDEPVAPATNGHFYVRPITQEHCLFIHRIGHLSSFDQVVQVKCHHRKSAPVLIDSGASLPLNEQVPMPYKFVKTLYLETQDFAE
ncbi:hypothetical protein CWB99_03155 [Pseudoalteromonas rubra]|uniref:Uncharacterized protein n=1 Tax=Pseudoalteromonas rubra TaxID=43658 RepID=A0A5S3WSV5_9GAMM|nr:hypothetical protein [Pseudoalteromonas rubra]TMP30159.1 hypothetical protein CWC00_17330 [Pseudoalteromonas rubra]TMP31973.1 hypothetical protein CWB99_03155 [Pseudoalteromonas rubra]